MWKNASLQNTAEGDGFPKYSYKILATDTHHVSNEEMEDIKRLSGTEYKYDSKYT